MLSAALAILAIDDARGQDFTDQLTRAGVTPVVTYEGDLTQDAAGGVRRGATYTGNLHVQLALDGERLAGLTGVSGFVDALWIQGGQPDKLVGDTQGVSSITAPAAVRLYEAWLQYNTPDNRYSVLAGRYDLNTEFYRLTTADLFLNSSFGIGPEFGLSGYAGPSVYPDPSLGVRIAYKPSANSVIRAAVMDAAPLDRIGGSPNPFDARSGALLVAEAALLDRTDQPDQPIERRFRVGRHLNPAPYDGKFAIGAWSYTTRFSGFAPNGALVRDVSEAGAYVLADRLLFQSPGQPARRVTGFVQLGIAEQGADRFGSYLGVGLAFAGIVPERPDDQAGIAAAIARSGSGYISALQQSAIPVAGTETAIEVSYLAQIAPWLAIQPDLQYVIHPSSDPRLSNATVAQLRFELTF